MNVDLTVERGIAARIWCEPAHSHKEMAADLAESIANALRSHAEVIGGAIVAPLASFILEHVPGEPSQDAGAIDTAIRLLSERSAWLATAREVVTMLQEMVIEFECDHDETAITGVARALLARPEVQQLRRP